MARRTRQEEMGPRFRRDVTAMETAITSLNQGQLAPILRRDARITIEDSSWPEGKVDVDTGLLEISRRTRLENVQD